MSTASDIVVGALRRINATAPGQPLDPDDAREALSVLNDLIESWTIEHLMIFGAVEQVFPWTAGQYSYTIGSPALGTPGATFIATVASGSPTMTVSNLQSLIALNNLVVGATLLDSGGAIPSGTKVSGLSGTTLTMSANSTANVVADSITFTGQVNVPLPARISTAFTRIASSGGASSALDYPCDIITQEEYSAIGIKNLPGPWPTGLYYNRNAPIGEILVWMAPSSAGEAHLWCDYVFTRMATLSDPFVVPEGYARAIKLALAVELAPMYGRPVTPDLAAMARDAKAQIKALNGSPTQVATFDAALAGSGRRADAGWVLHGGFRG